MVRHCYKLLIPSGFVAEQKVDTEMFVRSGKTDRSCEELREELVRRLKTVTVEPVTESEFEAIALYNVLNEPTQTEMFKELKW